MYSAQPDGGPGAPATAALTCGTRGFSEQKRGQRGEGRKRRRRGRRRGPRVRARRRGALLIEGESEEGVPDGSGGGIGFSARFRQREEDDSAVSRWGRPVLACGLAWWAGVGRKRGRGWLCSWVVGGPVRPASPRFFNPFLFCIYFSFCFFFVEEK